MDIWKIFITVLTNIQWALRKSWFPWDYHYRLFARFSWVPILQVYIQILIVPTVQSQRLWAGHSIQIPEWNIMCTKGINSFCSEWIFEHYHILLKTYLFITQLMTFNIPVDTENKGKTFLFTQLSMSEWVPV